MSIHNAPDNNQLTYRRLRRVIGSLGMALPIFLLIACSIPFFKTSVQSSISHFYYTNLREVFTGILCAVGLFMIRYKGFGNTVWYKNDNLLTNLAGAMAICIAFVPTNPDNVADKIYTLIPYTNNYIGYVHYGFALVLFTSFSTLSIFVFTLGQQSSMKENSIFNENHIYRICGIAILCFIILIPIAAHYEWHSSSTLILETLSLIVFGISWLIKGRALGDKGAIGRKLYNENNQ